LIRKSLHVIKTTIYTWALKFKLLVVINLKRVAISFTLCQTGFSYLIIMQHSITSYEWMLLATMNL